MKKIFLKIIVFLCLILTSCLTNSKLQAQEKCKTIFGPYYRNNTFTPLLINYNENFNAVWVENKFTRTQLIFNQNKEAEIIVKIQSNGTRFELIDNRDEKLILNIGLQSIPEEIPLVAILKNNEVTLPITSESVRLVEVNTLPENELGLKMLDLLIISDEFQSQIPARQTEAIKNWVLSGGTLLFDSTNCLKTHSGIAVPLLKQILKQNSPQTNDEQLMNDLQQLVTTIQNKKNVTHVGNGAIGIKNLNELDNYSKIETYCDGTIKWNVRNRNSTLINNNSLKKDIAQQQTFLLQKIVLVYFLIILIFLLLKPKQYFARFTCVLAGISLIPIIYLTPTNYLNAHYYQLNIKKPNNQLSLNKEQIYLQKGDIAEINITLSDGLPYFVNEEAKSYLYKNINGQYEKQTIQSAKDFLTLNKTCIMNKKFIEKFNNENSSYIFHRNAITNILNITEDKVRVLNFNEERNEATGIITKLGDIKTEEPRDRLENTVWYTVSNQLFYTPESKTKSIYAIEGALDQIPLQIHPPVKTKKSFLTYLITNE